MNESSPIPSRRPAFLAVTEALRDRIERGHYRPGDYLPSERDLAEELGVSRQTVRQALEELARSGSLAPESRRGSRVLEAELARRSTRLAALVIYEMARGGAAAMFRGAHLAMQEAGYQIIVSETRPEEGPEQGGAALRSLLDFGVEGILAYVEPSPENVALLHEAGRRGIPVVQLDRAVPDLDCDYVGVDNRKAAAEAVGHLLDLGHTRIAFLGNEPEASTVTERRQGYQDALLAAGVTPSREWLAPMPAGRDGAAVYREAARRWLALPLPPTAVFAANDTQACKLVEALRFLDCPVPDRTSVVGFDNQPLATLVQPTLTTVAQPFLHLGRMAGQMLIERVRGTYLGGARRLLLPTQMIIRGSTAAPPRDA